MMLHAILSTLILQHVVAVAVAQGECTKSADPNNPGWYLQLVADNNLVTMACPDGLVFNADPNVCSCDYATNVQPTPTAATGQTAVQPTASTQVPTQTPPAGQTATGTQNPNDPNLMGVWVGGPFAATNPGTAQQTGTPTQQYPLVPYPNQQGQYTQYPNQYPNQVYPNQQGQVPAQSNQYPPQTTYPMPYPNQNNLNQQYPAVPYPNQQYPNQQYPNQQYPNQQYPNQQYPNQQYPNQQYPNQQYPNTNQQYPNQQYPNQQFPNNQQPPNQQFPSQQFPNNNQQFPGQGGMPGQSNPFSPNGGFGLDSLFGPGPFPVGMSFNPMAFMPPPQMPPQIGPSNSQQGLTNYALAHAFDFSDPLRNIYALQAMGLGGGSGGAGGGGGGPMGFNPLWFILGNM